MGYSGGTSKNPSYHDLGDHTETVQVDYDPAVITYEQLLAVFWASHHPGRQAWSRQYLVAIFYHDEDQRRKAQASLDRIKGPVLTEILPATEFYLAEDYHQKYYLRLIPDLFREFQRIYPNRCGLTGSTAAARANGYTGGYGALADLQEQLPLLGLSPAGQQRLLSLVADSDRGRSTPTCPVPKSGTGR